MLQRRAYGETRTEYLLLGVDEIADRREIGFTLYDSHRSFDSAYAEAASCRCESPSSPADEGTVFRIDEIADVFARNADVDGLYFEVQIWNPDVLKGVRVQRTSL